MTETETVRTLNFGFSTTNSIARCMYCTVFILESGIAVGFDPHTLILKAQEKVGTSYIRLKCPRDQSVGELRFLLVCLLFAALESCRNMMICPVESS